MLILKTLIASTLAACALSLPAMADNMDMQAGQMMFVSTAGKLHIVRKPDKDLYAHMMSKGEPMPTGIIVMMTEDGKMVIAKDDKMGDGKMLSEHVLAK